MKKLIWLFLLLILYSCEKNKNPISADTDKEYPFAIYFLKNKDLKIGDVYSNELNELELADSPWLTNEDIRFYDWSSHCIYLKNDKMQLKEVLKFNDGWDEPYLWSKPYVVTSYNKKCYMGFFNVFSSSLFHLPHMDVSAHILAYPKDVLSSWWKYLYVDDIRNNDDIKEALIQNNLFRGGISIAIDTTQFFLTNNEDADTTCVEYIISIVNQDQDNLYVLDPALMKNELFFYFNNGLVFKNLDSGELYQNIDKAQNPDPHYYSWYPEWFLKLAPGQTLNRMIKQKYPYLPEGRYIFETAYNSPVITMEKDVREITDGRYWLGDTKSKVYSLSIE